MPTFYILHGTQELLLEEGLRRLRARMPLASADLNVTELDGATVRVAELLGLVTTSPFLADQRLVIVHGLLARLTRRGAGATGRREADALYAALPDLPQTARLVLVERQELEPRGRPNRFLQLARSEADGYEQAFRAPRDVLAWVQRRAESKHGATLERDAARALVALGRGDLRRIDNELFKLAAYVDGARPVQEDDVALLTPWVAEARTFDLTDALAEGKAQRAQTLLQQMLAEDTSSDGLILFATVVTHFRRLLLTREHLLLHGTPQGLASALGVRPGRYLSKLQQQSRRFSLAQLEDIYRKLQEDDFALKTGGLRAGLALELLVAGLA